MDVLKIPYESQQHAELLKKIQSRWYFSRDAISQRYTVWSNMEDKYMAFMPTKEADSLRKSQRKQGTPQYTTIEIPYSYAQLLSAHTYWATVFLSRSPIMQFTGRHGETEQSIAAVEAIMDYQVNVGKMLMPLYIWLLDVGKYGVGIMGNYWDKDMAIVTEIVMKPKEFLGLPIPGTEKRTKVSKTVIGYEGNKLYNVRPYDWFPDPRVPMSRFQDGEFVSRYAEIGFNQILKGKAAGRYFNVDELKKSKPSSWQKEKGSARLTLPNDRTGGGSVAVPSASGDSELNYYELLEMYVELIPSEWGLGNGTYPEKWFFAVGNDKVIICAQPLGLDHNKYPFHVIEYELEGYGLFKRSMLEMMEPLNDIMTWLFNSHFYNVRKVLNDQFVVDPSKLVMKDWTDPQAGRLLRLKPSAYGTDPKTAYGQLQVSDVTQNNLRDSQVVAELIQRMTGANESIMGQVNPGGRKTATEIRSSSTFGVNRLKTNAEIFSAQGFAPMSEILLQTTQQLYDVQKDLRIAGSLMRDAQSFMNVTSESIAGFYDFVPVDGTMPVDRFAMAALWGELMKQMATQPALMMQYDLGRIFSHVAWLGGIKNIDQFRLNVTPDQKLAAQMQAGNVVPLGGKGGRPNQAGTPGATSGVQSAPQIPGMGPTG